MMTDNDNIDPRVAGINLLNRLQSQHEWGYRDTASGDFIPDDAPALACAEIKRLRAALNQIAARVTGGASFNMGGEIHAICLRAIKTESFEAIEDDIGDVEKSDIQDGPTRVLFDRILDYLRRGPASLSNVQSHFCLSREAATNALNKLSSDGHVHRDKRRQWCVVSKEDAQQVDWHARKAELAKADGAEWDRLFESLKKDWLAAYLEEFVRFALTRKWTEGNAKDWASEIMNPAFDLGDADPLTQAQLDVIDCEMESKNG